MNQSCCLQDWPKLCARSLIKCCHPAINTRVKMRPTAQLSLCLRKHHAVKMYTRLKAEFQTFLNSPTNVKWTVTFTFQPLEGLAIHGSKKKNPWFCWKSKPHQSVHGKVTILTEATMITTVNMILCLMENTEYFDYHYWLIVHMKKSEIKTSMSLIIVVM